MALFNGTLKYSSFVFSNVFVFVSILFHQKFRISMPELGPARPGSTVLPGSGPSPSQLKFKLFERRKNRPKPVWVSILVSVSISISVSISVSA